jgi:lycopene cyclase CruA
MLPALVSLSNGRRSRRIMRATEFLQHAQYSTDMPAQPESIGQLAKHYPRTIAAFTAMGALDHLERIVRLDAVWAAIRAGYTQQAAVGIYQLAPAAHRPPSPAFDLIYAGGGLGLLHAVVMAQHGHRVMLFDRGEVGCAHREWNISRAELAALVACGFCSWAELDQVIMAEYDTGVVRFHAPAPARPTELRLDDVLNVAIDAGALLQLARRKLIDAGGVVLDRRSFRRVAVGPAGPVAVEIELARDDGAVERHTARLLLDGMGSGSPLALRRFMAGRRRGQPPFSGVCPTVGTVASGFVAGSAPDEYNPRVGDILLSVANAQRGQQYMWEGFPGRGDELTVYLFYYDTLNVERSNVPTFQRSDISLMQLFEDYFALLPSYKRPGPEFRHIKPVYGYIPARHSVRRQEAPLLRGVLPIGDSAAQQSPLTFCGFGSHVRNLARTTSLLHAALGHDLLEPAHLHPISAYQVNVSLNWVFSRFMQPWRAEDDVNKLQNIFLGVLSELGPDLAQRFFRDQMRWGDYHRMVLGMFRQHPQIVAIAWRVLGPSGIRQWIGDYLAYCWAALAAWAGRRLGNGGRAALLHSLHRVAPAIGLRLRARFAEWQAMGWI